MTLLRSPRAEAKVNAKTCKAPGCKAKYFPARAFQSWCSPECGYAILKAKEAKEQQAKAKMERKADRVKRESLKTRSDWIKEAQRVFNAYVRARDRAAGHPCISSRRPLDWTGNAVDAGHYRSVGAAPHLRFDPRNCHAQSKHDNQYKAGNVVEYRLNLIDRIGLEAVEALESDQTPRRHTIEELKQIIATYRAKTKELLETS